MTFEEFETIYNHRKRGLELARADLERRLKEGIEKLRLSSSSAAHKAGLFRVRLTEARVKKADRFFEKIVADGLDPSCAFEPHYMRDLLGARLVCHNLRDVEELAEAIKQGGFSDLHYVEPPKGEKDWIHIGDLKSGYRAWHGDVRWQMSREDEQYEYAEIQIRTLLQDAWASFMHDDVHKLQARLMLSTENYERFQEFSFLLYAADRIAEGVRNTVESARISEASEIKRVEAINQAMFFMVNFLAQPRQTTRFSTITRVDTYTVDRTDPVFCFELRGNSAKPEYFSMLLGGDTPNGNFSLQKFECEGSPLENAQITVDKGPEFGNTVLLRHKHSQKRKKHNYLVQCVWKGVFDEGREYVWCPWSHLYRDAQVAYILRLHFVVPPTRPPILYRVREYKDLGSILGAFEKSNGGIRPNINNNTEYEFQPDQARDDFLCLFAL